MRTPDQPQDELFFSFTIDSLVPDDHPLRIIRQRADRALRRMEPLLDGLYARTGRPSVPVEWLLRALLLQVLYGYRSERRLMQELQYNFALRWFVGLTMGQELFDVTVFTKNRQRLVDGDVAQEWLRAVVAEAQAEGLLDEAHFSVDGTLIQAWAGERSYQPKDDPPAPGAGSGRRGTVMRRDRFVSTSDPEARLYRKHRPDKSVLAYLGHLVMENSRGFILASGVTPCSGTAERDAALALLPRAKALFPGAAAMSVGADKAYHEYDFIDGARALGIEPHVGAHRRQRIDMVGEAVRETPAYQQSQRRRKWIERCFAWLKAPGRERRTRFRGRARVDWSFTFAAGVYNLLRLTKLAPAR